MGEDLLYNYMQNWATTKGTWYRTWVKWAPQQQFHVSGTTQTESCTTHNTVRYLAGKVLENVLRGSGTVQESKEVVHQVINSSRQHQCRKANQHHNRNFSLIKSTCLLQFFLLLLCFLICFSLFPYSDSDRSTVLITVLSFFLFPY